MDVVSDFRWKHRLIIVFSQGSDTLAIERLLASEKELIVERDILWFVVTKNSVSSNYLECVNETLASSLRDQFQSEQFNDIDVVLVGKDGKIKHRSDSLSTIDLYFRIDQMPMRQSEMKSKG